MVVWREDMDKLDYSILNLEPGADMEEVQHRYDMLMKRSLRDDSIDVEAITKAYEAIIAKNTVDYFNPDAELLDQKGLNKKKVRNYIYQNKLKLGILTWILIALLLLAYILIFQPRNISFTPDLVPY